MSGFFHIETVVKRPRKPYRCELCGELMRGVHMRVTGFHYDFYSYRCCLGCLEIMNVMCSNCESRFDCIESVGECFTEYVAERSAGEWLRETKGGALC